MFIKNIELIEAVEKIRHDSSKMIGTIETELEKLKYEPQYANRDAVTQTLKICKKYANEINTIATKARIKINAQLE